MNNRNPTPDTGPAQTIKSSKTARSRSRATAAVSDHLNMHFRGYSDTKMPFSLFESEWQHFRLQQRNDELHLIEKRNNDQFITFCADCYGGFDGKSILELGPHEGFHTCALVKLGAGPIVSIEANPRNFLKCLIVQNYYQFASVNYRLGDFAKYLQCTERRFDFVLAAGVLYHLSSPLRVLNLIIQHTDAIGICTSFFDEDHLGFRFTGRTRRVDFPGTEPFVLYERDNPKGTRGRKHGIDGSSWMFTRSDLLRFLEFEDSATKSARPCRNSPARDRGSSCSRSGVKLPVR